MSRQSLRNSLLIARTDDLSSTTPIPSNSRKKRCHVCKDVEALPAKPLIRCCRCKASWHPHCHNPKIVEQKLLNDERSDFTCARCAKNLAATPKLTPSTTQMAPPGSSLKGSDLSSGALKGSGQENPSTAQTAISCEILNCKSLPLSTPTRGRTLCKLHQMTEKFQHSSQKLSATTTGGVHPAKKAFNKNKLYVIKPEDKPVLNNKRRRNPKPNVSSNQKSGAEPSASAPATIFNGLFTKELPERGEMYQFGSASEPTARIPPVSSSLGAHPFATTPALSKNNSESSLPGLESLLQNKQSPNYDPPSSKPPNSLLAGDGESSQTPSSIDILGSHDTHGGKVLSDRTKVSVMKSSKPLHGTVIPLSHVLADNHAMPCPNPDPIILNTGTPSATISAEVDNTQFSSKTSSITKMARKIAMPDLEVNFNFSGMADEQREVIAEAISNDMEIPGPQSHNTAEPQANQQGPEANPTTTDNPDDGWFVPPRLQLLNQQRRNRATNFDPTELDSFLYEKPTSPPTDRQTLNSRAWGHFDPRKVWRTPHTAEWLAAKRAEIALRPSRKSQFGILLTKQKIAERRAKGWGPLQEMEIVETEESREKLRKIEELVGMKSHEWEQGLNENGLWVLREKEVAVDPKTGEVRRKPKHELRVLLAE